MGDNLPYKYKSSCTSITIPETGFLRLPQILKLIPIGKSSWWNGVKSGRFPKSVNLGGRITAWKVEDIKALIESYNQSGGK